MALILRKKERERCALCGREMQHKNRPRDEWNIDGFLCGDCHLDKMREYYAEGKVPPRKVARCERCDREVDPEDLCEPHRGMNLKGKICKACFEGTEKERRQKLEHCAICGKKLGFFRYNPKNEWKVEGQICRKCWDTKNVR